MRHRLHHRLCRGLCRGLCCLLPWLAPRAHAAAQSRVGCGEITEEMGFTIRSVRVAGRWVPKELAERARRTAGAGAPFSADALTRAISEVSDELAALESSFPIRTLGATSVLFVTADVCDASDAGHPRQADVVIRPYYLRIDLLNVGANILPIPRSARATFYRRVPALLRATTPVLGVRADRRYGPSLGVATRTNLLDPTGTSRGGAKGGGAQLNLALDGRRSLSRSFHDASAALGYDRPQYGGRLGWGLGGIYMNSRQPLAGGEYRRDGVRARVGVASRLHQALLDSYALGGGVRFTRDRYALTDDVAGAGAIRTRETGFELHALSDGRLGAGLLRGGVWFDAGFLDRDAGSYRRLAGRAGYATELGAGHNTVGVELVVGGGAARGSLPEYGRFFGGSSGWNFLYQPLGSAPIRELPAGPVLRSFGEGEAALRTASGVLGGGTSYWHANLNLSLPVGRWARPLIPDITLSESARGRRTLRTALKGQANSVEQWIYDDLVNERGYPDDEGTEAVATRIVDRDIRPPLTYLADRANVYAVKPVLLVDVARIAGPRASSALAGRTWLAAGAGVQINVVNARLDAAYLHTLAPAADNGRGNVVLRLSLQNFY